MPDAWLLLSASSFALRRLVPFHCWLAIVEGSGLANHPINARANGKILQLRTKRNALLHATKTVGYWLTVTIINNVR